MRDRGSMSLLVVLVGLAITASTVLALEPVLSALIDRQRAAAAADAAALAGVVGGRAEAVRLARDNGGELVAWLRSGDDVTVMVAVGSQQVTARASVGP